MKWMLTLKHWQLFALFFVPFVIQVITLITVSITTDSIPSPAIFFIGWLGFILMILWLYALGASLHKKMPPHAQMKLTYFRISALYPAVYFFIFAAFIVFFVEGITPAASSKQFNPALPIIMTALILPLHILAMVSMIYNLIFVAKSLKSVELQKPASVADYLGDFFLIWFFPIGVWVVQPRVNEIFSTE